MSVLIEKQKKEQYKNAMLKASTDKLYLQDMHEVEADVNLTLTNQRLWESEVHEME